VISWSATHMTQLAYPYDRDEVWRRHATGGAWAPWVRNDELAYAEFNAAVGVSATSEAAPNGIVTAPACYCDVPVLVEFYSPFASIVGALRLAIYDNGASTGFLQAQSTAPLTLRRRLVPAAGNHTFSVGGWQIGEGAITIYGGVGGAGAFVPGFIRVTRA
jgi:hypothetical protein